MPNPTHENYTARLLRAFKQAPWRRQIQVVTVCAVGLLIIAVMGGLYLTVAARAGTAGRDLQALEERKAELIQSNDELRANLAQLRSVTRLEARAREMGFHPAQAEEIEYLAVKNYPTTVLAPPGPAPLTAAPAPPSFGDWVLGALRGLTPGIGGGS